MASELLGNLSLKGLKTWQKVAVVAGGLGVAGLAFYETKKRKTASAATSSAAQLVTDPVSGQQYPAGADDPATGVTYAEEIAEYGSVMAADDSLGGENVYGNGAVTVNETPVSAAGAGYSTNAQWSQAVTSGLSDIGYSSTDIATALGQYLAGRQLTPDQQVIVYDALAEYGPPPAGTFAVIAAPSTVSGPASTGSTVSSSVSGGHVVSKTATGGVVAWTPHGPATQWKVTINGPGKINGQTNTVPVPQATYSGLESKHTYTVHVQPVPSGTPGNIDLVTS